MVMEYSLYIDRLLEVLETFGIFPIFISDHSKILDFEGTIDKHTIQYASDVLEVPITRDDYLWEVGQRLKEKEAHDKK